MREPILDRAAIFVERQLSPLAFERTDVGRRVGAGGDPERRSTDNRDRR
ncbi:hypothetical protein C7S13_4759 [Burkholderia cepacia]|nr:hypothetical protein [Burkholderia cepacia]